MEVIIPAKRKVLREEKKTYMCVCVVGLNYHRLLIKAHKHTPLIPEGRRPSQEDQEYQVIVCYIASLRAAWHVRPYLRKAVNTNKHHRDQKIFVSVGTGWDSGRARV